jgi:hypothetical protein
MTNWRSVMVLAFFPPLLAAAPHDARACVYAVSLDYIGKPPSPRQRARAEARLRRDAERRRVAERRAYLSDVRTGRIDAAAELARRLIPNVRETVEIGTDCDPGGDGDGPPVPPGALIEEVLAGTEFAGLPIEGLTRLVREYGDVELGRDCSTEVRAAFVSQLLAALPRRKLVRDCLELCRAGVGSAARFEDALRRRRPVWQGYAYAPQLATRSPELARELQTFWDAREPDLPHLKQLCPLAWQADAPQREALLHTLRQDPAYAKFRGMAARAASQNP